MLRCPKFKTYFYSNFNSALNYVLSNNSERIIGITIIV